jgi:23S rRNA (guanine745-N1)-methyltransferase
MLQDVVEVLRCPHCGAALTLGGGTVRCEAGHSFDVARQGYVSLLPGDAKAGTADTAAMVAAREAFLGAGHYSEIGAALVEACGSAVEGAQGCLVDLGAGTGHYLAAALEAAPDRLGLALDISKHALRRAARAHPRIGAVVCDAWQALPVKDGSAAIVLSVFAPRDGAEIQRILAAGGTLVLVTPTALHLHELVSQLGLLRVDEYKPERVDEKLGPFLEPVEQRECEYRMSLSHRDIEALVGMGPSARHIQEAQLEARLRALPEPLEVTASVSVATYRPR